MRPLLTLALGTAALAIGAAAPPPPAAPASPAPTPKPEYTIKPLPGFSWDLYAMEPVVEDPVAFAIDDHGNLFVAESFRQEKGIEDNRSSAFWLNDDLQLQSVADRIKMYEKWASKREGGMSYYRREEDRVVMLRNPGPDGRPTSKSLFSGPMNQPEDGTGAGLMCLDGTVWYTCIPNLWRFSDPDANGVAQTREKLFTGFGIRTALRGHDMHGLVQGPDGRIYWSIGDRGYRVTTKEGKELSRTFTGAVFRCEPDGSGLEVFAHSLRNPQELAFNQWGDLFTGDNNSDAGDRARIVYIMQGSETGWDMNYQTLEGANQRGPWNQEHIWWKWDANDPVRPAWTLPPIDHQTDGPAGMCFYPGIGFPARYDNHFFLCDFLGGDEYSRVISFAVEPDGAGYKVVDAHPFVNAVLATDVDFGHDGRMYISDWSNGWYSDHTGQIYRVWDPELVKSAAVKEVGELFQSGFKDRHDDALIALLGHPDIRVRQRAHLELAGRSDSARALAQLARSPDAAVTPRLHALWALGVMARRGLRVSHGPHGPVVMMRAVAADGEVVAALTDRQVELRRLAARLAGDDHIAAAAPQLISLLTDDDMRVRAQAAIALGQLQHKDAFANLAAVIWENDNQDPYLRHAAVMGLVGLDVPDKVHELAADQFPQNRLAAVLVMRRMNDPQLARLLHDPDLRVATEAARAVNDLPIEEAQSALAALASRFTAAADDGGAGSAAAEPPPPPTQWKRELWANHKDVGAEQLATSEVFSTPPTRSDTAEEASGFSKAGDNYVQRLSGLYTAPTTGEYLFAIASDDDGVLMISPDERADHAAVVARVQNYTNPNSFDGQPGQRTKPISLEAGKGYWIEARARQAGGGNHLSIAVAVPQRGSQDGAQDGAQSAAQRSAPGPLQGPIGAFTGDTSIVPLARRVINANLRLGTAANAAALADIARNATLPPVVRVEAMAALADFMTPGPRDRVNGHWRPVDASTRNEAAYVQVLKQKLPSLIARGSTDVRTMARELAGTYSVPLDSGAALATVEDSTKPAGERVACLVQLTQDKDARVQRAIDAALASDQPALRAQGRASLAIVEPRMGVPLLVEALEASTLPEQQSALAALARSQDPRAQAAVASVVEKLVAGTLPRPLQVDAMDAADSVPELKGRVAAWRAQVDAAQKFGSWMACTEGGDADRGRALVNFHSASACLRCHTVEGTGGHAAPPLAGVATRYDRAGLVASLVDPNATVAEGFGPVSAMPAMGTLLTPREVRDIVEYLATLK